MFDERRTRQRVYKVCVCSDARTPWLMTYKGVTSPLHLARPLPTPRFPATITLTGIQNVHLLIHRGEDSRPQKQPLCNQILICLAAGRVAGVRSLGVCSEAAFKGLAAFKGARRECRERGCNQGVGEMGYDFRGGIAS